MALLALLAVAAVADVAVMPSNSGFQMFAYEPSGCSRDAVSFPVDSCVKGIVMHTGDGNAYLSIFVKRNTTTATRSLCGPATGRCSGAATKTYPSYNEDQCYPNNWGSAQAPALATCRGSTSTAFLHILSPIKQQVSTNEGGCGADLAAAACSGGGGCGWQLRPM